MLTIKRKSTLLKAVGTVLVVIFVRSIYYILSVQNTRVSSSGAVSEKWEHHAWPLKIPHVNHPINHSLLDAVLKQTQNEFQNVGGLDYGDLPIVIEDNLLNSKSCVNVTRPRNTTYCSTGRFWHLQKTDKDEIMVYSAVYDDRPLVGITPMLRLSVTSTLSEKALVYCYLWYPGLDYPHVTTASIIVTGRGERLFGKHYGQLLYSCQLSSSLPIPKHVSLSTRMCGQSDILVPIYIPVRQKWQHEFGVCVAIAFGEVDAAVLSEWMELHQLFGVSEFNIYNASMSASMKKVFNVYEEAKLLQVHQMPPPVPDYSPKGSKLGSPASLNDCMLKNMYRYRYIIVIDFDEFIVPKIHQNYTAMLQAIDEKYKLNKPWMSYTFRNVYYFKDINPDETQPEYLTTVRNRKRSEPSGYLFAPKSFVSPLQCLSVFNHYCLVRFPGAPSKFTIDVSPDIASSHHYRYCGFKKEECQKHFKNAIQDDFMLQFKTVVETRVKTVLQRINYLMPDDKLASHNDKPA